MNYAKIDGKEIKQLNYHLILPLINIEDFNLLFYSGLTKEMYG